mmetsp:Transcript_28561/g.68092  ORF Transcript_28561/g.68092 Transcript_28561/m.68092 type:complete len:149 (-) Transcript_28561:659-1105(-)
MASKVVKAPPAPSTFSGVLKAPTMFVTWSLWLLCSPPGHCGLSTMSSLALLVMPGLEILHCVSRADGNLIRPANPAASEHERSLTILHSEIAIFILLDKVWPADHGAVPTSWIASVPSASLPSWLLVLPSCRQQRTKGVKCFLLFDIS